MFVLAIVASTEINQSDSQRLQFVLLLLHRSQCHGRSRALQLLQSHWRSVAVEVSSAPENSEI